MKDMMRIVLLCVLAMAALTLCGTAVRGVLSLLTGKAFGNLLSAGFRVAVIAAILLAGYRLYRMKK